MEARDIYDSYTIDKNSIYTSFANEIPATPSPSAQKQAQGPPPDTGDTVKISAEAHAVAMQAEKKSPSTASAIPSYSTIKAATTSDGTQVLLEAGYGKDVDGKKLLVDVRVTFTGQDGTTSSHTLTESAVFTQNEKGQWEIHPVEGPLVTGTDKDDVIIMMPKQGGPKGLAPSGVVLAPFNEKVATDSIDAGEGNNVVVDFSGEATKIRTGSGNDTIVGSSDTGRYIVDAGAGDDVIELYGNNAEITAGDGDDTITMQTRYVRNLSGGAGNDVITLKGREGNIGFASYLGFKPVIAGDDGDDIFTMSGLSAGRAHITGGNGNDTFSSKNESGVYIFDGGDGDDNISIDRSGSKVTINGGNGKDSISVNISGGTININGDNDDDYIEMHGSSGYINIHGGSGNDKIHYDVIHGGVHEIYGDAGNDNIDIGGVKGGSISIDGGKGYDDINIGIASGATYLGVTGEEHGEINISPNGIGNNSIISNTHNWFKTPQNDGDSGPTIAPNTVAAKPSRAKPQEISEYERLDAEAAMGIAPQNTDMATGETESEFARVNREAATNQTKQTVTESTALFSQKALLRYGQQNTSQSKNELAVL